MIKQTGVIRGKTRRVLDSTVLDDAVATQDTVSQLVQAPRRSWWDGRPRVTTPGRVKPDIAWDDKAAKAGYGSSRRHPDDCCGWFVRLCAHPNGTERGFGDLRVRRSTAALRRRSPSG